MLIKYLFACPAVSTGMAKGNGGAMAVGRGKLPLNGKSP